MDPQGWYSIQSRSCYWEKYDKRERKIGGGGIGISKIYTPVISWYTFKIKVSLLWISFIKTYPGPIHINSFFTGKKNSQDKDRINKSGKQKYSPFSLVIFFDSQIF